MNFSSVGMSKQGKHNARVSYTKGNKWIIKTWFITNLNDAMSGCRGYSGTLNKYLTCLYAGLEGKTFCFICSWLLKATRLVIWG